jgi:EAL domain-containing protein (putative c-di-GMP-specific phosphodiesterase class I)/GGDEF domain-containing protein
MTKAPQISPHESERLEALRRSNLLYAPKDAVFDRISQLASKLLGMPLASVTLIDEKEQWFKSFVGSNLERIPRENSFCRHTIRYDHVTVVPDTTRDPRFADNPFVVGEPGIRFYAGAPIKTPEGHHLGTLCVLDTRLRPDFQDSEVETLGELADLISSWIKMRESAGYLDATTGIFTRQRMLETLEAELRNPTARAYAEVRLVGIVDIAMPKQMHDLTQVMGYSQTEQFIVECINRLSSKIGLTQDLYRIGLYRFGFFMNENAGAGIQRKLDALIKTLHEPFDSGVGLLLAPSAKLGVTMVAEHSTASAEDILRQASVAADDAWESSRGWTFYKPHSDAVRQRKLQLLTELPGALTATDQLYLVYQPKIDLATNACLGVEALLRWQHPTLGFVSPIELIEAAEKTALMRPLTNWVLDAAIAQCAQWRKDGLSLQVAVNLSAYDLSDDEMVSRVSERLVKHDLPGEHLELEFTESTLIRDLDAVLPKLQQLHVLGVSTAIDDFGTGYCNLSYLQKLDVSKIKIDRRFVQTLEDDPRGQTLTRAIVNLAHDLDYQIVAEGIENDATLSLLMAWGCEQAQGYLFSRPLAPDALFDWVHAGGSHHAGASKQAGPENADVCFLGHH